MPPGTDPRAVWAAALSKALGHARCRAGAGGACMLDGVASRG